MINWEEERTNKNYCGYCKNTPSSGSCSGSCFEMTTDNEKTIQKNRNDHCISQLKELKKKIKNLKKKREYFYNYLTSLKEDDQNS